MIGYAFLSSPVGPLLVAGGAEGLVEIRFAEHGRPAVPRNDWIANDRFVRDAIEQLQRYFDGHLRKFTLSLAPRGTEFQKRVWSQLLAIPYGETRTYGEIAGAIGRPTAFRAVGAANGANPIPIVVPCHRVVGANGSLTGFGGGLAAKEYLLRLERR